MLFDYKTNLNVTERFSYDQRVGSLYDTIFCCKALRSKQLTRLGFETPNYSVASFFAFMNSDTQENR